MEDKEIKCISGHAKECEGTFIFSAKDQEYYAERQFVEPKRCKPCREEHKRFLEAGGGKGLKKESTNTRHQEGQSDRELLEA